MGIPIASIGIDETRMVVGYGNHLGFKHYDLLDPRKIALKIKYTHMLPQNYNSSRSGSNFKPREVSRSCFRLIFSSN